MNCFYYKKIMSIYSGFATRHLEQTYDHIIYNVIETLLLRLKSFYNAKSIDQLSFIRMLNNQVKHIRKMEERKYLQPKYTPLLQSYLHIFSGFQQDSYRISDSKISNKKYHKRTLQNERSFSILSRELSQLHQGLHHIQKDIPIKNKTQQKQLDYTRIRKRKFYKRQSGTISVKKSNIPFYNNEDIFEKASQLPSVNKSGSNTIRLRKQSAQEFNSIDKSKIKQIMNSQHINFLQSLDKMSKNPSEKGEKGSSHEQEEQDQKSIIYQQPKILKRIPKFRSKMYYNNKLS